MRVVVPEEDAVVMAPAGQETATRTGATDREPFRTALEDQRAECARKRELAPADPAASERRLSVTALPGHRPDRVVVAVVGHVDTFTAPLLEACLHSHATRPGIGEVIVDLRRVSYLGDAGVRAMARAEGLCRRRGARLSVRHDAGVVQRTLQPAGLGDLGSVASPVGRRSVAVPERPAS